MATSLGSITNQQANGGSLVSRCLGWLDDERASEVAPAVSGEDQRTSKRSMCVSSHVEGASGESDGETYRLRIHETEADESAPCVRLEKVSHTHRCDGAKDVGLSGIEKTGCVART
jgi:hypothetical protein